MSFDFAKVLGSIAPTLADTLISAVPGGPLVKKVLSTMAAALGLTDDSQSSVEAALRKMTPADALALTRADQQFAMEQLKEKNRTIETLEAMAASDRDSARKREISVKDNVPRNLSYALTIGFFGALVFVIWVGYPPESRESVMQLINTLNVVWIGCMAYYFGTTANSGKKDDVISRSLSLKE